MCLNYSRSVELVGCCSISLLSFNTTEASGAIKRYGLRTLIQENYATSVVELS